MRLFIACPLPEEIRSELQRLQALLKHRRELVHWPPPENLHLTVAFLGEVEEARIPRILEAMEAACRGRLRPELELGANGWFGKGAQPRVLWTGLQDKGKCLTELVRQLEQELREAGFSLERRRFRAHITIGRVKRGSEELCGAHLLSAPLPLGFRPRGLVLYESRLKPTGAEYRELAEVRFEIENESKQ